MKQRRESLIKALFASTLLLTFTACGMNSAEGEREPVVSNCFTQLHPGPVQKGKMTNLIFQNGACFGEYKALNKISYQNEVVVEELAAGLTSNRTSEIIRQNEALLVRTSGGLKRFAMFDDMNNTIIPDPGVEFELMIPTGAGLGFENPNGPGSLVAWQPGSGPAVPMDGETLVLRLPL